LYFVLIFLGAETVINKDGAIKIDKKIGGKKTAIHIHNSKNVQVGNNNVMVINQTSNPRRSRKRVDSSSDSSDSEDDVPAKAAVKPISEICEQILSNVNFYQLFTLDVLANTDDSNF
jgi:hypothetical protein